MRLALLAAASTPAWAKWDTTGFFDWFADSLTEAADVHIAFDAALPDYLEGGTFVQTGPGRFSFGDEHFNHLMDGYSKTLKVTFSKNHANFSTKFLASGFFNASVKDGHIDRGIFVGGVTPDPQWGPTAVLGANDNNYIKMRKVGDQAMLLADVSVATLMEDDFVSFETNVKTAAAPWTPGEVWHHGLAPPGDMCMLSTLAHAAQDPVTGTMTAASGCFGLAGNYIMVYNLEASAPTTQELLAKIPLGLRQPPYMHAMGVTDSSIILIDNPLTMNLEKVLEGKALGRGGLETTKDNTIFYVVDRKTGAVRKLYSDAFLFGHLLNSYEEKDGDIVLDLTWYEAGNQTTLGWLNRFFFENMHDDHIRESWPKTKVLRYRLGVDGKVEHKRLFQEEQGNDDFETPKINEHYNGKPYCVSYMLQFHSYDYKESPSASEPGPFAAVGLAKRNVCTGEKSGWYEPNHYPSEVQFVPNPRGTAEDDGVLLGVVFDGSMQSSYFQVLDAKTMKQIAIATLPVRSPFLIHSSWFPSDSGIVKNSESSIVV